MRNYIYICRIVILPSKSISFFLMEQTHEVNKVYLESNLEIKFLRMKYYLENNDFISRKQI